MGTPGTGAVRSLRGPDKEPPGLMDPTRQRDGHRILALFRPYRTRLTAVLVLIVISAGVSMLSPFLLRQALDVGIVGHDNKVLTLSVLGMLGTRLMEALLEQDLLTGGDGAFDPDRAQADRLSAPGTDFDYRLTPAGLRELKGFGIDFDSLPTRRPLIRYCVDWSEQRHHLAGSLGAAITTRMVDLGWVRRAQRSRAVHVSDNGYEGLREQFGIELSPR